MSSGGGYPRTKRSLAFPRLLETTETLQAPSAISAPKLMHVPGETMQVRSGPGEASWL